MQNKFKAPQRKLQSSWQSEVFKKPTKRGTVVNYSLYTRTPTVVKSMGKLVESNSSKTGYLY